MRLVDAAHVALAVALMFMGIVHAAEPQYGKVETFEPGKKYNCMPTPDHKGWDCKETGKESANSRPDPERRAEALAPAPAPAPQADTAVAPAPAPETAMPAKHPPVDAAIGPPGASGSSPGTALPSYLRAPKTTRNVSPAAPSDASASAAPAIPARPAAMAPEAIAPAAGASEKSLSTTADVSAQAASTQAVSTPASNAPSQLRVETVAEPTQATAESRPESAATAPVADAPAQAAPVAAPAPATPISPPASAEVPKVHPATPIPAEVASAHPAPTPVTAEASTPRPQAATPEFRAESNEAVAATATAPTPAPTSAVASSGSSGNHEFLALPGSSYIVELAHGGDKSELDTLRGSLQLARGELYELHLQRDGRDWWLLVWGTFDSVDAARAARGDLPADAPINAGWPRLIAPLQAEARRTRE